MKDCLFQQRRYVSDMKDPKTEIARYHNLQIKVERDPAQDIIDHLKNTTIGTPGGLLYKLTGVEEKIRLLDTCYFLVLRKSGRLLGTMGFVLRNTYNKNILYSSWHIRYFSIRAPLRTRIHKKKNNHERASSGDYLGGDSILRVILKEYFDQPNRLISKFSGQNQKTFLYAYIERDNVRSMLFSDQMDFQKVRRFSTILFSRLNPRVHPAVQRIKEEEKSGMLKLLRNFYSGYNMYTEQHLFYNNNYYLLKLDNEIVAGVQANPETWKIIKKPGFPERILFRIMHSIPGILRFFDPDNFKFAAIEGIYYKKGYEKYLLPLFESLCALTKTHFALMWLDTDSPLTMTINKLGHQGFLSKIIKRVEVDVIIKFINFSEQEKESFRNNPVYISCFDVT
jgi:hypothetical protein